MIVPTLMVHAIEVLLSLAILDFARRLSGWEHRPEAPRVVSVDPARDPPKLLCKSFGCLATQKSRLPFSG
ncbi:hypothetical protein Nepgr_019017 [Nepenthes gracilis]|uniref:Uncharacterized protein n=1 Tax=Nepenthes gracilis TaxID=150966 RepID=A0AAD3XUX0_NEPGR|nr:hypothetical protein Nepgr_019017 [Nepenthes gracilis]